MSATGRGAVRKEQDFYPTPLSAFYPLIRFLPRLREIWEPACGDGRLVDAMLHSGLIAGGDDLLNGYDYLKDNSKRATVVTNPPFSLAFEFCQHAVEHAAHVFLLLRLNFLASQKRKPWFVLHEPAALFVLSERPKFVNGRTDACDYAWFYWGPMNYGIYHL